MRRSRRVAVPLVVVTLTGIASASSSSAASSSASSPAASSSAVSSSAGTATAPAAVIGPLPCATRAVKASGKTPALVTKPAALPQSGTVRACSAYELEDLLASSFTGTILIPANAVWNMVDRFGRPVDALPVKSGVSIIGERGPLGARPTLYQSFPQLDKVATRSLFTVTGNNVVIRGLHLRGPKPLSAHATHTSYVHGVRIEVDKDRGIGRNITIDDNEIDQWSGGAVSVQGAHSVIPKNWDPAWAVPTPFDAPQIMVTRNYLHHNAMDGGGYGVVQGGGAYVMIEGNVFDLNRHAVASDGKAYGGYIARHNYILNGGVVDHGYYNQHFDAHGTRDNGYGGAAGEYYEIASNTIRGHQTYYVVRTRPSFELRGRPTLGAYFTDNVDVHDGLDTTFGFGDAYRFKGDVTVGPGGVVIRNDNFHPARNHFATDYSSELASGDFDGDLRADVFVANGTGWFYSRAGIGSWEFMASSSTRTRDLGFADIDNDGRTDILSRDADGTIRADNLTTHRVVVTSAPVPMSQIRFGDFDGDQKTDMFYTRNGQWWIWHGSTRQWTAAQTSGNSLSTLVFGNFDGRSDTDVATVLKDGWYFSSGGTGTWRKMNAKLANSFEGTVTGDFDADGRSDIAFLGQKAWRVSFQGRGPLVTVRSGAALNSLPKASSLAWGAFDGRGTQVIGFQDDRFWFWGGVGTGSATRPRSGQNMR